MHKEEYCRFYARFLSDLSADDFINCASASDDCDICGCFQYRERSLVPDREKGVLSYFRENLRIIVDAVTLPEGAGVLYEDFPVDMIMKLRGAVAYAHEMGDLDRASVRILTDELNRLYEEASDCPPGSTGAE